MNSPGTTTRQGTRRGKAPAAVPGRGGKEIAPVLKRGKPSRKVAKEMLLMELRRLRAVFSEIAQIYREEAEGRIAAAEAAVEAKELPDKQVRSLLEILHSLEIKPKKGRRKDLARIEKAAGAILGSLEE